MATRAKPLPPPPIPEAPTMHPADAIKRLNAYIAEGRTLAARRELDDGPVHAWQLKVEEVLAAGFGRNSAVHLKAVEAGKIGSFAFDQESYWDNRRKAVSKEIDVLESCLSLLEDPLPRAGAPAAPVDAMQRVTRILDRFQNVVRSLKDRRTGRAPLTLEDEYDVQYLLGALLRVDFEDVREEEHAPSFAGKSSRFDFLLKAEQVVVEVKMTRPKLGEKELSAELSEDAMRYRSHTDCKTLVCFVWDPDQHVKNPEALERDLQTIPGPPELRVFVRPK